MNKIYSIEEITELVVPIAQKYRLKAVYLFGSYARNTAGPDSDIDLIVDTTDAGLDTLFKLGGLYSELEETLKKQIDLVTVASIMQPARNASDGSFREHIWKHKVGLYVAA